MLKFIGRFFWAALAMIAVYVCAGTAWINTRSHSLEILAGLGCLAFFMSLYRSDIEAEHAELLAEIHKLRKEIAHGKSEEACCKEDCGSKADR